MLSLVEKLPEQEQRVVLLRYFSGTDGHTVAEIAAITLQGVGTVTKQLSRAMSRLRPLIEARAKEIL